MIDKNDRDNFIKRYNHCLDSYKEYKRDYLLVSFIHYQFKKDNPDFDPTLLNAKLQVIINKYRVKKNPKFDKEKYVECSFVWENINDYLLSVFSIISENRIKDNPLDENLDISFDELDNIIDELNLSGVNISGEKIKKVIKKLQR